MEIETSTDTSMNIQVVKPVINNVEQSPEIMVTICDDTHKKPISLCASLNLSLALTLVNKLTELIESTL